MYYVTYKTGMNLTDFETLETWGAPMKREKFLLSVNCILWIIKCL